MSRKNKIKFVMEFDAPEGVDEAELRKALADIRGLKKMGLGISRIKLLDFNREIQISRMRWNAELVSLTPDQFSGHDQYDKTDPPPVVNPSEDYTLRFQEHWTITSNYTNKVTGVSHNIAFHGFKMDLTGLIKKENLAPLARRLVNHFNERADKILANDSAGKGEVIT